VEQTLYSRTGDVSFLYVKGKMHCFPVFVMQAEKRGKKEKSSGYLIGGVVLNPENPNECR
jgi:hypothetical protein